VKAAEKQIHTLCCGKTPCACSGPAACNCTAVDEHCRGCSARLTLRPWHPAIPDVLGAFYAYKHEKPDWGPLVAVLGHGNTGDGAVKMAMQAAAKLEDDAGQRLARILFAMSRSQRARLPRMLP
jgi:hypothetical protein